jgi:N6-L-threonylcarbamoyladenine synthase
MRILAIETSCDETAIALIEASGEYGSDFEFKTLGNAVLSQVAAHEQYGGVFPNVAKREHGRNLTPVLGEVFRQAGLLDTPSTISDETIHDLERLLEREPDLYTYLSSFLRSTGRPPELDAIAVTVGPGLEPALWVGINFARALSSVWNIPVVPVNHMEGHIVLSAIAGQNEGEGEKGSGVSKLKSKPFNLAPLTFPLLSLLISGGHTEIVLSERWMEYKILGQTRDDAVGEAFDKVARLLGLPYPGGPQISRIAERVRNVGVHEPVELPRPMIESDNYDFSFSGLKTAVRRLVETYQPLTESMRDAIAKEFEDAAADVLVAKLMRAIEEFNIETVLVGGGVSANTHIRRELARALEKHASHAQLLVPPPDLATDNALMIALAGYFRATKNQFESPENLVAQGNLKLA